MSAPLRMPNVLKALALSFVTQVFAFAIFLLCLEQRIPFALLIAGIGAFILSCLMKLSIPWRIINLLFPTAIGVMIAYSIPSWIFPLIGLTLFALYLPAFFAQVPFFPTSPAMVEKLLDQLPLDRPFTFVDLGCGFGEPIFSLAKARPNGTFHGIDLSPFSVLIGKLRALIHRNVKIRYTNLWSHSLGEYDFVYAFLAPPPMERMGAKVAAEMKQGSKFLSNSFPIPDRKALSVRVADERQNCLFIYTAHD